MHIAEKLLNFLWGAFPYAAAILAIHFLDKAEGLSTFEQLVLLGLVFIYGKVIK